MSNYYGAARTNYFRVKSQARFQKWAAKHHLEVIHDDKDKTLVALLPGDLGEGLFPSGDADTGEDFDLLGCIAKHLKPGEVAVLMESGHEKARYITGIAEAINSAGKRVQVSLQDIYQKAVDMNFGHKPTACEY